MMAVKIICFAAIGAVFGLIMFGLFGVLIALVLGVALEGVPPFYVVLGIPLIGIPVGAYYGATCALRSQDASFKDYFDSIKDFLNGP